jgi:hypothetical protein
MSNPNMIQLSKKEKGRLKKLHSKSTLLQNNNSHSFTGIVCNEEAQEYQLLVAKKNKIIDGRANTTAPVIEKEIQNISEKGVSINAFRIDASNDNYLENTSNHSQKLVPNGPSIQLKSSKNKTKEESQNKSRNLQYPRVTEGDDHRNLLHGLLFHKGTQNSNNHQNNTNNKKNKKRKHQNNDDGDRDCRMNISNQSFHIPSWATIHNPALVQNIAVLEFSITNLVCKNKSSSPTSLLSTDDEQILRPILASKVLSNNSDDSTSNSRHQILYTKMKLFQDNNSRPKHITDVLMYSDRKFSTRRDELEGTTSSISDNDGDVDDDDDENCEESGSDKKRQRKDEMIGNSIEPKSESNMDGIYTKLKQMVLTDKQLSKEGYPTTKTTMMIIRKNNDQQYLQSSDDDDNNTMNSKRLSDIQCIYAQLLDYAKNINEFIQLQGNNSDIDKQKYKDDINQFISSSSIQVQANNIIQTLHMHQSHPQNDNDVNIHGKSEESENTMSHNSRLFVTSCLDRKDITSSSQSHSNDGLKNCNVYALDCEMVRTTIGLELARISLILFDPTNDDTERYKVVLDSYVKPKNYVLDYVTQ